MQSLLVLLPSITIYIMHLLQTVYKKQMDINVAYYKCLCIFIFLLIPSSHCCYIQLTDVPDELRILHPLPG